MKKGLTSMKKDYSKIAREMAEEERLGNSGEEDVIGTPIDPPKAPVDYEVVGCEKLNVRTRPDSSASILTVINRGTVVMSDESPSDKKRYREWLHIYLKDGSGTEGFCMSKFLKEV